MWQAEDPEDGAGRALKSNKTHEQFLIPSRLHGHQTSMTRGCFTLSDLLSCVCGPKEMYTILLSDQVIAYLRHPQQINQDDVYTLARKEHDYCRSPGRRSAHCNINRTYITV
jgi:hypothetical protein